VGSCLIKVRLLSTHLHVSKSIVFAELLGRGVGVTESSALSSAAARTAQIIHRSVLGPPVLPVFKGQALKAEPNLANNAQPFSIKRSNIGKMLQ
jgi:hypothetical protein